MRKLTLIIILIHLLVLSNAQISDSYVLTPNDLTISKNGKYDVIITQEKSFTDEIGSPQLPVKIISFVLPYNSTVSSLGIAVTQEKLNGSYYIFPTQPQQTLDGRQLRSSKTAKV